MVKVKDIESAIKNLSKDDLSEFRTWYEEFDAKVWDIRFEEDASSGRLDNGWGRVCTFYKLTPQSAP